MCQPGMTTGVLSAHNSIDPPQAVCCPISVTFLVTQLLPIPGDAAPLGQAGGCPVPTPAAGYKESITPDPALAPSRM